MSCLTGIGGTSSNDAELLLLGKGGGASFSSFLPLLVAEVAGGGSDLVGVVVAGEGSDLVEVVVAADEGRGLVVVVAVGERGIVGVP